MIFPKKSCEFHFPTCCGDVFPCLWRLRGWCSFWVCPQEAQHSCSSTEVLLCSPLNNIWYPGSRSQALLRQQQVLSLKLLWASLTVPWRWWRHDMAECAQLLWSSPCVSDRLKPSSRQESHSSHWRQLYRPWHSPWWSSWAKCIC